MKIYSWKSRAFADDGFGKIIATGSSVADARKKVKKHFAVSNSNPDWLHAIALDIACDPEVIESGVLTMYGGE